jgi:hypothetical protein
VRRPAVLERDHLVEDRLETAREEQSHHVIELAPVGHRGADDVDLLPEHERSVASKTAFAHWGFVV